MNERLRSGANVAGRVLMSLIFIAAGAGKIGTFEATQAYMVSFGVPAFLLVPTIIFELGAGLLLLIGGATRPVAFLLAGFTLVSAAIFHSDFSVPVEQIMFLKNIAIAGGLLLISANGISGPSVDRWMAKRA